MITKNRSRVNGIDTEEMKTMIVEDDDSLNDEPLHTENSQASGIALNKLSEVCV